MPVVARIDSGLTGSDTDSNQAESAPANVRYVNRSTNAYLPFKADRKSTMAQIDTDGDMSIFSASLARSRNVVGSQQFLRCHHVNPLATRSTFCAW